MADDYRNTKYCPELNDILSKKKLVKDAVISKHRKAKDMHRYISKNNEDFKKQFIKAYNGKCAYCGVSDEIINWKMFEIDHFIPKTSARFKNKAYKAGYIENLVLSCYDCNRAKRNFECSDEDIYKIHPDYREILESFVRDDNYYIKVSESMKNDITVNKFYKRIALGNQMHRIDYLLMSMRGLSKKITSDHPAYGKLMYAIDLLQQKRNIIR